MTADAITWLLPALVHVQVNLEGSLDASELAAAVDRSPSHFARRFTEVIGETPRAHVERLRLERAAVMLLVRRASILEIALDCGYQNHETFSRAFFRRYGVPPSRWRAEAATRHLDRSVRTRAARGGGLSEAVDAGRISETRIRDLAPMRVLFIRHTGPYEHVPSTLWDDLLDAAVRHGLATDGILVGIAHDAPEVTDPGRLRFDAGLVVSDPRAERATTARIGVEELPGGTFAVTTHVGPYASIPAAYAAIVERLIDLGDRLEIIGLPTIELYRTTRIDPAGSMNQTDIAIPVIART